jgi:hypothetical protein
MLQATGQGREESSRRKQLMVTRQTWITGQTWIMEPVVLGAMIRTAELRFLNINPDGRVLDQIGEKS